LLDFYNRPHPHINRFQYWELRIIWLMLRGECFRLPVYGIGPDGRRRLERVLIAEPSHFQHIIQDHQLIGWRYLGLGPNTPLASQVFLPEEVWFEKLPNPFNFWRGLAPLVAAASASNTDFAASAFMRGIIENNADTGVIVRTDKHLEPEQQEQISALLRQRKRKAGMADRPILLNGVTEVIRPQFSSGDLQFLENRRFSRSEICSAFGVPEELITSTEHAKYDVMHGARLNFIENRVAPLCRRLEAEEDQVVKSLDPAAEGWFDLDSLPVMQEAWQARLTSARTGFEMGVPFNELNRVLDLGFNPLPWGNQGFVPQNFQPLGEAPAVKKVGLAVPCEPRANTTAQKPEQNPLERALRLLSGNGGVLSSPSPQPSPQGVGDPKGDRFASDAQESVVSLEREGSVEALERTSRLPLLGERVGVGFPVDACSIGWESLKTPHHEFLANETNKTPTHTPSKSPPKKLRRFWFEQRARILQRLATDGAFPPGHDLLDVLAESLLLTRALSETTGTSELEVEQLATAFNLETAQALRPQTGESPAAQATRARAYFNSQETDRLGRLFERVKAFERESVEALKRRESEDSVETSQRPSGLPLLGERAGERASIKTPDALKNPVLAVVTTPGSLPNAPALPIPSPRSNALSSEVLLTKEDPFGLPLLGERAGVRVSLKTPDPIKTQASETIKTPNSLPNAPTLPFSPRCNAPTLPIPSPRSNAPPLTRSTIPIRITPTTAPGSAPILDFISSDETLDRYGEIITAAGWQLDHYRKNPVFQNAHQYGDVLFTLGKALITEVRTIEGRPVLFQRIEFATEVNPLARIAFGLYQGGFLNAVSVGFVPIRWENGTAASAFTRKYLAQELLEVSAVSIPANPNALALGLRAGAVARTDVKELLGRVEALTEESAAATCRPGAPTGRLSASEPNEFSSITAVSQSNSGAQGSGNNEAQLLQLARHLRRILG
jgi:phage portal protein BeeE